MDGFKRTTPSRARRLLVLPQFTLSLLTERAGRALTVPQRCPIAARNLWARCGAPALFDALDVADAVLECSAGVYVDTLRAVRYACLMLPFGFRGQTCGQEVFWLYQDFSWGSNGYQLSRGMREFQQDLIAFVEARDEP